jgi:GPH family glycoside/pentoside/hexuronide:cation symporter
MTAKTAETPTSAESESLSFKEKFSYSLGDTASNLFWMTFIYFGTFFYTDVFGISAAATGTLLFAARILDTVFDPVIGMVADRTNTRWGKFRPFMLWGVLPFGICGTLAFVTPPFDSSGKLAWAYVTYGLVGLVYSTINLPYSALMGVISPSTAERTKVSSFRFVGAYSGGLIVSLFTKYLVSVLGAGNEQRGWAMTVGLYAGVGMVMWVACFANTKERVTPPADQSSSFDRDVKDVMENRPWLVLFLLGIFSLGYQAVRNGCIAYYFKYYVGDQVVLGWHLTADEMVSAFFVTGSLATLVATSLVAPLAQRLGKKLLYSILMGATTVLTIAFYLLRPQDVVWMFLLQLLVNAIMGPTAALVFAMYADASDYSEWKTGRRSTGLVFAASSFAQKMGWALGGAATGWILAAFGYQAGKSTAESLHGIRMLISVIPAACSLLAMLLPFLYSLGDDRVAGIERELAERRKEAARQAEAGATALAGLRQPNARFGGNRELADYVLTAPGIGRQTLNALFAAGVILLLGVAVGRLAMELSGWLVLGGIVPALAGVVVVFVLLGKQRLGWWYVAVMIGCVAAGSKENYLGIVGIIVFVVAWIHANGILTESLASAGPRLTQIRALEAKEPGAAGEADEAGASRQLSAREVVDLALEKGLLHARILRDMASARSAFEPALDASGGDAELLNAAGRVLLAEKAYAHAERLFDRAIASAQGEELIRQIKKNRASIAGLAPASGTH